MLAEKSWVADLLPEGALTSLKDAIGQEVSAPLIAGEVVNSRRLGDSSTTLNVPAGFVAISIPVKVVQSVGGSIAAGQYVEVYATGSTSTSQLIKSALVLAVSAVSDAQSASSSAWVTLAVGPDSVLELVSAAQNLQLYLTLPGEEAAQASQNDEQREEELAHALGEDAASSTGNQTPAAGGQANSAEAQAAAVKNPTSITFSIKNKAHLVQQNGGNHE
jgi:pilus assembly protein CpaB